MTIKELKKMTEKMTEEEKQELYYILGIKIKRIACGDI